MLLRAVEYIDKFAGVVAIFGAGATYDVAILRFQSLAHGNGGVRGGGWVYKANKN